MHTVPGAPEILYEDHALLVCRKPAGIPVQTAKPGQQDMESLLKNYRAGRGEAPELYVVHRLDQPVEGLMVFAKTQKAAASLSRQIQQKSVDKYYRAVVEGIPKPRQGTLEDFLLRDGKTNTSRVVPQGTKGAKKAVLRYRVVESRSAGLREKGGSQGTRLYGADRMPGATAAQWESGAVPGQWEPGAAAGGEPQGAVSLLEIQLETGRHHQIRVQLAHAGHPLVGDKKYNAGCQSGYLPIGLCSVRLAFQHPVTGKRMEFSIEPAGPAFAAVAATM